MPSPILKKDSYDNLVQESALDAAFLGDYTGANLIYAGYSRPGTATSVASWQIAKFTYSGSNLVSITWPQNASGKATSEYTYIWDNRASYTYS